MSSYSPESSFSSWLDGVIQQYETEFDEYWGVEWSSRPEDMTEDEWTWIKIVVALADDFSDAITGLGIDRVKCDTSTTAAQVQKLGNLLLSEPVFRQRLEVNLARELDGHLAGMLSRAIELMECLSEVKSSRAREYLERVSRTYVWGLFPEAMVMCGSALEAALDYYLDEAEVRRTLKQRPPKKPGGEPPPLTLGSYVRYLEIVDALPELHEAFRRVKSFRNRTVHETPQEDPKDSHLRCKAMILDVSQLIGAIAENHREPFADSER